MKKSILNKIIIPLFTVLFLFVTTGPAFAWHNRYPYARSNYHGGHGYHHGYSNEGLWVALGVGLLTGGLISCMVNSPASHTVVYSQPEPMVVPVPPREEEYAYAPQSRFPAVEKVMVTAQELNVRSGPGFNHAIEGYVVQGEALDVHGSAPGWFYVRTASGLYGWVMVNFTAPLALPQG
jgi:uncharacterized protein YgiM (DUF1202 family)